MTLGRFYERSRRAIANVAILGSSSSFGTVKASEAAETADTAQKPLTLSSAVTRRTTESLPECFVNDLGALQRAPKRPDTNRVVLEMVRAALHAHGANSGVSDVSAVSAAANGRLLNISNTRHPEEPTWKTS